MFGICSLSSKWEPVFYAFSLSLALTNSLIIGVLSEHVADAFSKGDHGRFRQYRGSSLDKYRLSSRFSHCCKGSSSHDKWRRHSSALSKTDRRNADYTWIGWVIFCFLIYQTWGFTWFVDSHLERFLLFH